jgi:hypothetical protein
MTEVSSSMWPSIADDVFGLKGYSISRIIAQNQVKQLRDGYLRESAFAEGTGGFWCSMFSDDTEHRKRVDALIKEVIGPVLKEVFPGYRPLFANYMVKPSMSEAMWPVHQDWTYVDEQMHRSLAVWIPLQDVTLDNGPLCMVPGSHRIEVPFRGPGIRDAFEDLHSDILERYHEVVEMQVGEVMVWDHGMVHFSLPNRSPEPRIAATVILVPQGAEVCHFWKPSGIEGHHVLKYSVDTDFYLRSDIFSRPDWIAPQAEVFVDEPVVTLEELITCYEDAVAH